MGFSIDVGREVDPSTLGWAIGKEFGGLAVGSGSADWLAGAVQPITPNIKLRANRDPPIFRLR